MGPPLDRLRPRMIVRSVAGVGLLTLALVGCGTSITSPTSKAAENAFLVAVHAEDPNVNQLRSDTQLVRLGSAACSGFSSGTSFFNLADTMQNDDGGLPSSDLGAVITAAAEHLCPKYRSRVS